MQLSVLLLLPLLAVGYCRDLRLDAANDEAEAAEYMRNINIQLNDRKNKNGEASWAYDSNITAFNEKIKNEVSAETGAFMKEVGKDIQRFDWKNFKDEDLKRQFSRLAKLGYAALPDEDYKELLEVLSTMQGNYAKAKICPFRHRTGKCQLSLDPEIEETIVKSKDPEELKHFWKSWYDAAGTAVRTPFMRYLELNLKSAKLNGYASGAEYWLSAYEDETFEEQLENIFKDIRPLYEQIHAYVRWQLGRYYGTAVVPKKKPIPMHLLGNMWAQTWENIADKISPFPDKPLINIEEEMVRQNISEVQMFEMGDDFFTSLNLKKLTQEFWDKSILVKPNDGRDLICHASAWDFFKKDDVRIKQCTRVSQSQLFTVHHELGHIQYYLQYQHLPNVYRTGANPGFHEAVGDVLALSVSTPKHLQKIGLLKNYVPDEEARINQLFLTALEKIVFLPFAFTMDKYRWALFRGQVKEDEKNCYFWKLRDEYSGIEPPVDRSEADFDAPAKYHVSADVEYLRYLVSFIIQFQFYKSACIKAGQYEPGNPALPLDNCDFYGSAEAGKAFEAMLSMGASKPWPDAMEAFTGERTMSGKAIAEYFEPLRVWLEAENKKNKVHVGWERSTRCKSK